MSGLACDNQLLSGSYHAGFGVWVFARGCEAGGQICNGVPVYVSWVQWCGTFDFGHREEFPKEADCCAGVDYFGTEFCECSIFGSLGVAGISQRTTITTSCNFPLLFHKFSSSLANLHVQAIQAPGTLGPFLIPCAL